MTSLNAVILAVADDDGNSIDLNVIGLVIGFVILVALYAFADWATKNGRAPRWAVPLAVVIGLLVVLVLGFDIAISD